MPERAACDTAIQFAQSRLRVADPELTQGQVEMFNVQNIHGAMPRPWGMEGGFAVVYKFRTRNRKIRALRCFRVPINPDIQFRYEHIGPYFAKHLSDVTAEFRYYPDGILIAEQPQPGQPDKKLYPLIDMEWIEGVTLLDHIETLCNNSDQVGLGRLADQWIALLEAMHQASMAHGDLAGGNIMVRPDGRLVLIDYDGVYIPDFAAVNLSAIVEGQPDYQHPQSSKRPFDESMDGFSALVIYTSLLALHIQPSLWQTHTHRTQQGKQAKDGGILFVQRDFVAPDYSPLFQELESIHDVRLAPAVQELKKACQQNVAQVRFPFHIIDPTYRQKQALLTLEQALRTNDDEEIARAWVPPLLDTYAPAQRFRQRVDQALHMVQHVRTFRSALHSGSMQQIRQSYNPILNGTNNLTQEECNVLQLVQDFETAMHDENDAAIVTLHTTMQKLTPPLSITFTSTEQQRIQLAQQRSSALAAFRQALRGTAIRAIVSAYNQVLDSSDDISQDERKLLALAQDSVRAYDKNENFAIFGASEAIARSPYTTRLVFTPQETQRIDLARQYKSALEGFQHALTSKNVRMIVDGYDAVLDDSKDITHEQRQVLTVAQDFVDAYKKEDDQALVTASEESTRYQQYLSFTPMEQQRITLAQQRKVALIKFRQAFASKRVGDIVAAYNPLLVDCKNVTVDERGLLALAHDLALAYKHDDDHMLVESWGDIQKSHHQKSFVLNGQEQQRMDLAQARMQALQTFRDALQQHGNKKDASHILASYDKLLDDSKSVSLQERELLREAERFMHMYDLVRDAIRMGNDKLIGAVYDEKLALQFSAFTAPEEEHIQRALKYADLEDALVHNKYGQAILLSQEIAFQSRKAVDDERLIQAKRMFIRTIDIDNIEVWLIGGELIVQWKWPLHPLVNYAIVVWRFDTWPSHPRKEEYTTYRKLSTRSSRKSDTVERINIGQQPWRVFVQVYLAIPADEIRRSAQWFYSNGEKEGSRKIASL